MYEYKNKTPTPNIPAHSAKFNKNHQQMKLHSLTHTQNHFYPEKYRIQWLFYNVYNDDRMER